MIVDTNTTLFRPWPCIGRVMGRRYAAWLRWAVLWG